MSATPIRCIVETISSTHDRNGNRYHFAVFYNPAKGRHCRVSLEVGGESNARSIGYVQAGRDYEAVLHVAREVGKREWQALRKYALTVLPSHGASAPRLGCLYEHSPEAAAALAELFSVEG